jgi:hypothetical protein
VDRIRLESGSWSRGDVAVATTFRSRLRGMSTPGVEAVLIETRSVHSFGMMSAVKVVGLDANLMVRESRVLNPNRIAYLRGSRFVLELPADADAPEEGAQLEVHLV